MWSPFSLPFGHEMYWVNVFDLAAEARMSLLWRNGVIVKSGMQDWRRVGHYLVGMAITAPCDHFVDSWQPLLDNFGFFLAVTWCPFGDFLDTFVNPLKMNSQISISRARETHIYILTFGQPFHQRHLCLIEPVDFRLILVSVKFK